MGDGDTIEEEAVEAVLLIHRPRRFGGCTEHNWSTCVEDGQSWPCATAQAIERATGVGLRELPGLPDDVVDAPIVECSGTVIGPPGTMAGPSTGSRVLLELDEGSVMPHQGMRVDLIRRDPEPPVIEFSGRVIDAGGGHVTISVDRDTQYYPKVGLGVDVYPAHDGNPGGAR